MAFSVGRSTGRGGTTPALWRRLAYDGSKDAAIEGEGAFRNVAFTSERELLVTSSVK